MQRHTLLASAAALALIATPVVAQQTQQPATDGQQQQAQTGSTTGGAATEGSTANGSTSQGAQTAATDSGDSMTGDSDGQQQVFSQETTPDGETVEVQAAGTLLVGDLLGQPVLNDNDENIGNINDLILDAENGIQAAVIGVGGFLGIGEKDVAIEWSELDTAGLDTGEGLRAAGLTQEQLASNPSFVSRENFEAQQQAAQQAQSEQEAETQQAAEGAATGTDTDMPQVEPAAGEPTMGEETNSGQAGTSGTSQ